MEKVHWRVDESYEGMRIDKALSDQNVEWSRMKIQQWIEQGRILVNGKQVKAKYRLHRDEQVEIIPPIVTAAPEDKAEEIPLDVRYEDADLLVVNKPRGLVVHPAPGHSSGTLVNALLHYCQGELSGIGGVSRPGIVHRIDKDTSGLLIVAKNDITHQRLSEQLQTHSIERIYTAWVEGVIDHHSGTIQAPIGRDPVHRQRMKVEIGKGKAATTHFAVTKRLHQYTQIQCRLETGRTHQIRVHMKYIGYPLVGDPVYGGKQSVISIQGQALHARELHFTHPRTQESINVTAPLPADMLQLEQELRSK